MSNVCVAVLGILRREVWRKAAGQGRATRVRHRDAIEDGLQVDVCPPYEQDSRVQVQIKYYSKHLCHSE